MKVSLREVTRQNFDAIVDLRLLDHQYDFLASNAYSIAEASLDSALRTRAIYSDEQVIGFVLYCTPQDSDDEPGTYVIWRLMIDASVQGRGYGRRALELVLREICTDASARKIHICYKPDNEAAKRFYASLGFEEVGVDPATGEMDAVVEPARIRWSAPQSAA
ncbi:MAG: GNAT family N-acetyltransferase [Burkholderiales bacterium]|jgi:diamine N-acetyltransferase|nr:GNAT family N-acetyltransferase [Burkholderiales bacterium]